MIIYQLLDTLLYVHQSGIVHRDLKPENILIQLDETKQYVKQVKITDFGLSKFTKPGQILNDSCGTLAYVAPEVLSKIGYGNKVDIWSIGIIFHLLISGTLPFDSKNKKAVFNMTKEAIVNLKGPTWDSVSDEAKDLILNMLKKDINERFSI